MARTSASTTDLEAHPVYLHHRFQLGAVLKTVGGMEFRHGLRGDPLAVTEVIDADRQRRALDQLVAALSPGALSVPERVLRLLAPRPFGHQDIRGDFESRAGPAFDQLGIARTLARMVLGGVLDSRRMARVAALHQRDPTLPSAEDVVGHFVGALWAAPAADALGRVPQRELIDGLIDLASDENATVEARAAAEWGLKQIHERANAGTEGSDASSLAHLQLAASDIERFLERRFEGGRRTGALTPPPGTPIGNGR